MWEVGTNRKKIPVSKNANEIEGLSSPTPRGLLPIENHVVNL